MRTTAKSRILDNDEPIGVLLSIPLNAKIHNLDGSAVHDISKSWSTSDSIYDVVFSDDKSKISFSIDVYNLGAVESSYAIVECILQYLDKNCKINSIKINENKIVIVPPSDPSNVGKSTVRFEDIELNGEGYITHIYALVYDPIFDPLDAAQADLKNLNHPVDPNPARLSRKIACRNVRVSDTREPFSLSRNFSGSLGNLTYNIRNLSEFPADIVVRNVDAGLNNVCLGDAGADDVALIAQLENKLNTVMNSIECTHDLAWGIHIFDGNTPYPDGWSSFLLWSKKGSIVIDGKSKGRGEVVDAEYQVRDPSDPNKMLGTVQVRFLMR